MEMSWNLKKLNVGSLNLHSIAQKSEKNNV